MVAAEPTSGYLHESSQTQAAEPMGTEPTLSVEEDGRARLSTADSEVESVGRSP